MERIDVSIYGLLYCALVRFIFLEKSETLVLTECMISSLEVTHAGFARIIYFFIMVVC